MKKPIRFTLRADVYRTVVSVLVTTDKEAGRRFFGAKGFVDGHGHLAEIGDDCLGRTVYNEGGPEMRVWLKHPHCLGILAHELCHVAVGILYVRGIRTEPGNDEAFAYLYQSLFHQALNALGYGKLSW